MATKLTAAWWRNRACELDNQARTLAGEALGLSFNAGPTQHLISTRIRAAADQLAVAADGCRKEAELLEGVQG